ncbi:sugar phosphate permease [Longilinea arvoryzae]|uniref:Sugar phosphate permease n=1 Tax=Longilinea arvoryzae TaxID=360412 RepID=A0A0S7BB99_9CHLR|nr:MFS transporter [Longilinea arvoryzae]GAP12329.1 sugar phosphate permease [Longilinea arvoryzae]
MPETREKVYAYRWVVLAVFALANLAIQVLWICYAPISSIAVEYYGVSQLQVGMLAMVFMIVYVPISIPVSWLIDTLGYRKAVSIGVVMLGVFGLLRAFFASNFGLVMAATVGLGLAQPFLLNAVSTVAGRWFPIQERATASGLALVASFIGIAIGQVTSPILALRYGIPTMAMIFGILAAVSAALFLVFTRDAPLTPPCPADQTERALVLDGLKSMLKMEDIWLLLYAFLVGMGIFNGVSTWIAAITEPKGFSPTQAGDLGALLLIGGIVGAVIIPALSDHLRQRKPFLLLGVGLSIPCLIGIIYAQPYWSVAVFMFLMGFFLNSLAPIGYQYAAEITFPAPEGTSNGLLNLAGQCSVVFIYAMEFMKGRDGSFTISLWMLSGLMLVGCLLLLRMHESKLIRQAAQE